MKRILRIGMDVHSTNYTLCAMEPIIGEDDRIFANIQVTPDYKNILMFIENLKMKLGLDNEYDIQCGYEAGCLGYSLYNQLTAAGVKCVILAPATMLTPQGQRVKTDTGRRWMSIWRLMTGRRQRSRDLIRGLKNWHQRKDMKKKQRSRGASLESRPIQACHCLWRPGISAGLQRGIFMQPFLVLRRERVPAVAR